MNAPEQAQRSQKARELQAQGLGVEDIAVRLYGRADGITIANVRDLLREEGR